MTSRNVIKPMFVRNLTVGLTRTALALLLVVDLVNAPAIHAQSPAVATPKFEVVSIKPKLAQDGLMMGRPRRVGDRVKWTDIDLRGLIRYTYQVADLQLLGKIPAGLYDIDAIVIGSPSEDQLRALFQVLLEDRFKLILHRETKQMDIYVLTIDKKGTKLKSNAEEEFNLTVDGKRLPASLGGGDSGMLSLKGIGGQHLIAKNATMSQVVNALHHEMGRPVVDQTGLQGVFVFDVPYSRVGAPIEEARFPLLAGSIQDQLGLRLAATKGPVEYIVVDQVERPSEN